MTENDILGFDPSQLSVFNQEQTQHSYGPSNIYKTRPAESKSEDGVYRATIKIVYNPFDFKHSILEQQSYALHDKDGWFTVVSKLTNGDTSCPVFKAWKKCRYAEEGTALHNQLAKNLFDKRFARYCIVQILEDNNQPDLVGKYMFWKLPKSIYDIINAKMKPSKESKKAPIPIMDFLFGRAIDLEVIPGPDDKNAPERRLRETSYMGEITEDIVSCVNPDGTSLLSAAEQAVLDKYVDAMQQVWKSRDPEARATLQAQINADPNTAELQKIYRRVLDDIKKVCPNIEEELGYKDWTPEVQDRVNNWINIVLAGNDPAVVDNVPEALVGGTETKSEQPAPVAADPFAPENIDNDIPDDLPF
jgi:hypothetical protein